MLNALLMRTLNRLCCSSVSFPPPQSTTNLGNDDDERATTTTDKVEKKAADSLPLSAIREVNGLKSIPDGEIRVAIRTLRPK